MAIDASYPIVEEGQNSPHGEMFRCVYNQKVDACTQLVPPMSAVFYWDFGRLVCDQQPFGPSGSPIPAAPTAATAAAELYAAATGFPLGGHQDNNGSCEYAAIGVTMLGDPHQDSAEMIGMPAGIVVVDNLAGAPNAMTSHWPYNFYATPVGLLHGILDGLYIVKTRGIVQALVDGLCNGVATPITVGMYLEGNPLSWDLIPDAANANEGTFIALEGTALDNTRIWVMLVNIAY